MTHDKLLKIQAQDGGFFKKAMVAAVAKPLEHLLCFSEMNAIYSRLHERESEIPFSEAVLNDLGITYDVSAENYERIPKTGPAVVVSNHPFGAIEGLIFASLLKSVRPDVKIIANYILHSVSEFHDLFIPVDPFGRSSSLRKNIGPLKDAIRWLREGHILGVFPAGEVAHINLVNRTITDPPWSTTIASIIRRTKAPVLPVFFQGRNGPLFQALGLIHPLLRTVMLPREMLNKKGRTFNVSIGGLIPFNKLEKIKTDKEMTAYLRLRTYMLKDRKAVDGIKKRFPLLRTAKVQNREPQQEVPVAPGPPPEELDVEISALGKDRILLENNDYRVYHAYASEIPKCVKEIGRLREITFRQVGEGTGNAGDLDEFDEYYGHLFVWNKNAKEIIGAYRVGRADEIIAERGVDGLYTSTLFQFKPELFKVMGPALELGRSFVRPEYQRSFSSLLLLWKGIGQLVHSMPKYHILFGPVSISNEYKSLSRELIVRWLKLHKRASDIPGIMRMVKPKTPPKLKTLKRYEIRQLRNLFNSIDDVTEVIDDIETELKGIPVLLKQYLKLGGKILSFNVDPDFNLALDGLLVVDLLQAEHRIMARYMGKEYAAKFLAHHNITLDTSKKTA